MVSTGTSLAFPWDLHTEAVVGGLPDGAVQLQSSDQTSTGVHGKSNARIAADSKRYRANRVEPFLPPDVFPDTGLPFAEVIAGREDTMPRVAIVLAAALGASAWGCGATTRSATATTTNQPLTITGAAVTFMTRDDGKDEDSAIAVQLLDDDSRLSAEATVVDQRFGDRTVSQPLTLAMTRTLEARDADDLRVRLRLTPDGRDTWMFDMRLTMRLSDGTERQYFWSGLRLDEGAPERTLTLASGRMP